MNLLRISDFYKKFPNFQNIDIVTLNFIELSKEKIAKISNEAKNTSGILNILMVWGENDFYNHIFVSYDFLLDYIFSIYSANIDEKIIEFVTQLLIHLLNGELRNQIFTQKKLEILLSSLHNYFKRKIHLKEAVNKLNFLI